MTLITEIRDRAACAAWSPLRSHPDWVATGTKDSGGIGFQDTGGELEIYDMNFGCTAGVGGGPQLLGSIKTSSRFATVAWTPLASASSNNKKFPMGLIAGGMVDGVVHFWNPAIIINNNNKGASNEAALIHSIPTKSNGPVKALAFNILDSTLLAAGDSSGQVHVIDLSKTIVDNSIPLVSEPSPGHKQSAEITAVAWNSQVSHIVASASADGSIAVWDLNSRKAWCELRAEHAGQAVSDICWNPKQGLHLLSASADDRNPVLRVWDLGASTSMPVTQLQGHHQGGIFKVAWCPHDESLLLTTAKDNRTLLWDLVTMQPIGEVPNETAATAEQHQQQHLAAAGGAGSLFSQSSASSFAQKHMRYDVAWSPWKRGVALTCSLDRKVQAHSILSLATRSGRPPAWMKPSSAVTTAFGGVLVSCGKQQQQNGGNNNNNPLGGPQMSSVVTIQTVSEQPALVKTCTALETQMATAASLPEFCAMRKASISSMSSRTEMEIWGFMQVVFETNARQALLEHLGFRREEITAKAAAFCSSPATTTTTSPSLPPRPPPPVDDVTNGGMMASLNLNASSSSSSTTLVKPNKTAELIVKNCLLVGDFEAAVECCFQSGNLADALLLATCGEPDLWAKTQQRYFEQETVKRPYLSVVSAVIRNQMEELVINSNPKQWQETLAILSTYGKSEDFSRLCVALGNRLEEANDPQSASLCYMCGLSLEDSIRFWRTQLDKATDGSILESEETHLIALHDFVLKVFVILQAVGPTAAQQLSEDTVSLFAKYAQALAEQGLFVTAAKYVSDETASSLFSPQAKILRDRLYRSRSSHRCLSALGSAPEFPFTMVAVGVSRGQVWAAEQRQQAQQAQQAQQQYEQQQMQAQQAQAQQQQQQQYQQQHQQTQLQQNYAIQQQTSSSYHVQSQQTSASYAQAPAPQPSSSSDQLPDGWMALQDPTSGMMYYANQITGETTWERPQVVPQLQQPMMAAQTSAQVDALQGSGHSTKSAKLASKYGDGFVSSASNPELAQQYGNLGTSNPYHGAERPGPAAVQGGNAVVSSAPVSATLNYDTLELPADLDAFRDSLASVVQALKETQLTATDSRQLGEAEKSVSILVKKMARGDIFDDTKATVFNMVMALVNRDYGTAAAYQTALVSSDWKSHKDWLKGMKLLIQLASRKLAAMNPPGY